MIVIIPWRRRRRKVSQIWGAHRNWPECWKKEHYIRISEPQSLNSKRKIYISSSDKERERERKRALPLGWGLDHAILKLFNLWWKYMSDWATNLDTGIYLIYIFLCSCSCMQDQVPWFRLSDQSWLTFISCPQSLPRVASVPEKRVGLDFIRSFRVMVVEVHLRPDFMQAGLPFASRDQTLTCHGILPTYED